MFKTREFTGNEASLSRRRGKAESPETAAIREVLTESATAGGKKIEFADLAPRQLELIKSRLPQVGASLGILYKTWTSPDGGLVVAGTYKPAEDDEDADEVEAEVEPTPPVTPATVRRARKAVK